MLKVTVDTNVVLDYWRQRPGYEAVKQLLALSELGQIDLAVTARIEQDISRPPLAECVKGLPQIGVSISPSITRVDYWVLDRDVFPDDDFDGFHATACEIAKQCGENPPDWRDWDHLSAHYALKRDVFLTRDGGLLCLAGVLRERFGIEIMEPQQFLNCLKTA